MGLTAPGIVTGHLLLTQFGKLNVPRVVPLGIGFVPDMCVMIFLGLLFCISIYGISLVIHRLWYSPISHIPGPKLAAATGWYQAYYTVVHYGRWCFKVKELHERYGMPPSRRLLPIFLLLIVQFDTTDQKTESYLQVP